MKAPKADLDRRGLLAVGGALAISPLLSSAEEVAAQAAGQRREPTKATARRKLGALEVSAIGIGVQNMSRTFQTTVPSRPEMHNIIRTASTAASPSLTQPRFMDLTRWSESLAKAWRRSATRS